MKYLKFTQYIYLIAAVFFFYEAFTAWHSEPEKGQHWLFLIIALVCIFLFYFRRKFARKFEEHERNKR